MLPVELDAQRQQIVEQTAGLGAECCPLSDGTGKANEASVSLLVYRSYAKEKVVF